VVSGQIHSFKPKAAAAELSPGKRIEVIRIGWPVQELDVLQTSLDVPMDKLAPMLGISKATLHRRKAQGRLGPEESNRVLRFAQLMGQAVGVMEGEDAARRWLYGAAFRLDWPYRRHLVRVLARNCLPPLPKGCVRAVSCLGLPRRPIHETTRAA